MPVANARPDQNPEEMASQSGPGGPWPTAARWRVQRSDCRESKKSLRRTMTSQIDVGWRDDGAMPVASARPDQNPREMTSQSGPGDPWPPGARWRVQKNVFRAFGAKSHTAGRQKPVLSMFVPRFRGRVDLPKKLPLGVRLKSTRPSYMRVCPIPNHPEAG